jgi:hypothetical protein
MQSQLTYRQKRESASVVLLLIVFFTLIRPVAPLLTDALAHRFFSPAHEQLHQLGVNHLDDDLKSANLPSDNSGKPAVSFEQIFIFCVTAIVIPIAILFSYLSFKEPLATVFDAVIDPAIQPPDAALFVCPVTDIHSISRI